MLVIINYKKKKKKKNKKKIRKRVYCKKKRKNKIYSLLFAYLFNSIYIIFILLL